MLSKRVKWFYYNNFTAAAAEARARATSTVRPAQYDFSRDRLGCVTCRPRGESELNCSYIARLPAGVGERLSFEKV